MNDLLKAVTTPPGQQTNVGAASVSISEGMLMSDEPTVMISLPPWAGTSPLFLSKPTEPYLVESNFEYLYRKLSGSVEAIRNAVEMHPRVMHGNPVFRGTRIPVYQIIEELADGTPLNEIPEGYPSLSLEQIQRGLDFASSVMRIYDEPLSNR